MVRQARDLRRFQTVGEYLVCKVDIKSDWVFAVLDNGFERIIKAWLPDAVVL